MHYDYNRLVKNYINVVRTEDGIEGNKYVVQTWTDKMCISSIVCTYLNKENTYLVKELYLYNTSLGINNNMCVDKIISYQNVVRTLDRK